MKILFAVLIILTLLSFSQEKSECEERSRSYWANAINSRIEGEVPSLKKAFK